MSVTMTKRAYNRPALSQVVRNAQRQKRLQDAEAAADMAYHKLSELLTSPSKLSKPRLLAVFEILARDGEKKIMARLDRRGSTELWPAHHINP